MNVEAFITEKSKQITNYVEGYWSKQITYSDLQRFLWDTLEEWTSVEKRHNEAYTHQERIFWHLMQMLQMTREHLSLEATHVEIEFLLEYLNRKALCPIDIIGMRP